ncbi:uncharacterized protein MELLADRAFT_114405 [Melampsora larici-populina 98AG31]|uniref:Uncharacterized protein n=1 Tax=Melampsora larici-populina (strain 98AG31 / pathotype 3-4-7) TaxID=747676 RepID=F4SDB7_MELLP|nr:uncharacterized protein MELLADRAFT_114405 [Melampsora larici-populina 98AG31]EGF97363.1 hypothetical protein MELLADRAFT_114405 [Melampsora larici-populina 98AG31]
MIVFNALVDNLMAEIKLLYDTENIDGEFCIDLLVVFDRESHAWPIAKNADVISKGVSLRTILGSEAIKGISSGCGNKEIGTSTIEEVGSTKKKRKAQEANVETDILEQSNSFVNQEFSQEPTRQVLKRPSKKVSQLSGSDLGLPNDTSNPPKNAQQSSRISVSRITRDMSLQYPSHNGFADRAYQTHVKQSLLPSTPQTPYVTRAYVVFQDTPSENLGPMRPPNPYPVTRLLPSANQAYQTNTRTTMTTPVSLGLNRAELEYPDMVKYPNANRFNPQVISPSTTPSALNTQPQSNLNTRLPLSNLTNLNRPTLPGIQRLEFFAPSNRSSAVRPNLPKVSNPSGSNSVQQALSPFEPTHHVSNSNTYN